MKNLRLFSLLVMIGMVLFVGGCSEDEKNVSKVYDDPFFQKSYVTNLLKKEGTLELRTSGSSNVEDLIDKVNVYIQDKNLGQTKTSIQQRYGYPVWNATEFIREPNKVTTITPIVNVSSGVITNFFLTSSTKPGVKLILKKYTPKRSFDDLVYYFDNTMNGIENDISFKGTGESSGNSSGASGGSNIDCENVIDITILTSTTHQLNGNNHDDFIDGEGQNEWIDKEDGTYTHIVDVSNHGTIVTNYDISMYQHCFGNDTDFDIFSDGPSTTSSGGGGGGGSACTLCNISSWEDCKEKMNKIYPKNFSSSDERVRKELFDKCQGCATAYFWSNDLVRTYQETTSEKIKCLMCGGNLDHLIAIMNLEDVKMPCVENQDEFIDNLIPPCGSTSESNPDEYFSWKNIKKKLNGQVWFKDEPYYQESSQSIKDMGSFYGLSYNEIRDMEDEDICNKLTIMDCLKPSTLGEVQTISNQEKAQLLDFYKNTELKNPCTNEDLDKDGIFMDLCENGGMSLAGLDAALDGADYVDDAELAENCPCVFAIWKQIKAYTQTNNLGTSDCSVLEILDDFIEGPLQAEFGVTVNPTGNIRATTLPNTTYGPNLLLFNTRIEINKDLCGNSINIDPVSMAGTLLHEMVHARIYEHLYNSGHLTNVGPNSALWSQFVQSNYPGITIGESQHQIIAQAFVNDIAQALHDINGGIGDPSDYLYIAWQGLDDAFNDSQKAEFDFIPDFDQLKTNFNTNVKGQGVINYNGCN
jgi:hypothetical protein